MTRLDRPSSAAAAAAALALALLLVWPGAAALAAETGPLGCWKGETVLQVMPDGRSRSTDSSACTMRFSESRIQSRCEGPAGKPPVDIDYSYRIVRPGVYLAAITAHTVRADLVGSEREYEYRVRGDQLMITTFPRTTQPTPPTVGAAARVESVSRKVECP